MKPSSKFKKRGKAVVVGSGPNGLMAAITLARAGCDATVIEAADRIGGGLRTEELTLPGFKHDVCSAVHPLAAASPAIQSLNLEQYGLRWLHHEIVATHPFDDVANSGEAGATLHRSIARTAQGLGVDETTYQRLLTYACQSWPKIAPNVLGPLFASARPLQLRWDVLLSWSLSAEFAGRTWFKSPAARALLAGCAAHAFLPLHKAGTAGFGMLLLLLAHQFGWPIAQGGSQSIADALTAALEDAGGRIELGRRINSLADLDSESGVVFLDLTAANAAQLLAEGSQSFAEKSPSATTQRLRGFSSGFACWKIDYALSSPLPWSHSASRQAGTVHLGGSTEEISAAQRSVARGELASYPFTLVAQPTLIDPTRAPAGKHIAWVYAHVPLGFSDESATAAIERQLERFAPGFRSHVLQRSVMNTQALQAHNANYVSGDITGGPLDLMGLLNRSGLLGRSGLRANPYRLARGLYLCSASTPPGPGTHAMAGYHAANAALRAELS